MEDGSGLADLIPSLQASDMFKSDPGRLICVIRYGLDKNELTGQQMPANTAMNEVELANLVNYLRQVYAKGSVAVQTQEIRKCLSACKPD